MNTEFEISRRDAEQAEILADRLLGFRRGALAVCVVDPQPEAPAIPAF